MNFNNKGLGYIRDPQDPRDFAVASFLKAIPLPDAVDYQAKMSPVRDQAQRGACVSFASCAVKEYQENKEANFSKHFNFSEEWTYEQIRQPGGGANPRDAFKLFNQSGVCREGFMRYKKTITDQTENTVTFNPSLNSQTNAALYKAQTYARILSLDEMLQSLVTNGPFMIGVDWINSWFNPNGASDEGYPVLQIDNSGVAGGHALCVVGYNKPKQLIKFKNSWSRQWGNNGYAYFSFDTISKNLGDAWASIDLLG